MGFSSCDIGKHVHFPNSEWHVDWPFNQIELLLFSKVTGLAVVKGRDPWTMLIQGWFLLSSLWPIDIIVERRNNKCSLCSKFARDAIVFVLNRQEVQCVSEFCSETTKSVVLSQILSLIVFSYVYPCCWLFFGTGKGWCWEKTLKFKPYNMNVVLHWACAETEWPHTVKMWTNPNQTNLLDMSKAFGTLKRDIIIEDLRKELNKDEIHLVALLLENIV